MGSLAVESRSFSSEMTHDYVLLCVESMAVVCLNLKRFGVTRLIALYRLLLLGV
jgi:hypothetical protein